MAYFLGRDVELAVTTEHNDLGVLVEEKSGTDVLAPTIAEFHSTATVSLYATADKNNLFAGPRASIDGSGPWGDQIANGSTHKCTDNDSVLVGATWNNEPDNLTAIDLSMGVMDEDVAFIGQRNILKAEVKKEILCGMQYTTKQDSVLVTTLPQR